MKKLEDFNLRALFLELDAEREKRGMSWAEVAREINGACDSPMNQPSSGHQLAATTIKATGVRRVMEGDGVLQMLRWLNRSPESFVPGFADAELERYSLPEPPADCMIRFETRKLYTTIADSIQKRNISWKDAADELGMGKSQLLHLEKGGRTSFPTVVRIALWLNIPTAHFVRILHIKGEKD